MDIEAIKKIVELMKNSDIAEFEIEEEDLRLRICRKDPNAPSVVSNLTATSLPANPSIQPALAPAASGMSPTPETGLPTGQEETTAQYITSPMVGTFYQSPSPDDPSFVLVGAKVVPESVICIIEAMKVMNEIQAETTGTIEEILVNNGDSVEYGQRLFRITAG